MHNVAVERIHFHEVGAVDAIVDVVGACIGFELLGVERFVASPLHVGSGTVEMAHGRFPVPPPAVAELLRGAPVYSTDIKGELVTPTGAAIVATRLRELRPAAAHARRGVGLRRGHARVREVPERAARDVGETEDAARRESIRATRMLSEIVETNVDDVSPQVLGYLMEQAFARGRARLLLHATCR